MFGQTKPESWWHSPECDADYRKRRAQRRQRFHPRAYQKNADGQFVADPEEVSKCERKRQARIRAYLGDEQPKKRRGDPREALPSGSDLQALADTFGAESQTLEQGVELQRRGLLAKAKRLVLCGRIARRINCSESERHRFFRLYMCGGRYCSSCGPAWFKQRFSDLVVALEPVVERLLHEGKHRGRKMVVVARLDFTVPKTAQMPEPAFVRKFHADLRRFWRAAERRFGLSRQEYGVGGIDEFGGGNTNLHRHCVYVGPILPQKESDLQKYGYKSLRQTRERRGGAQNRASGCPFGSEAGENPVYSSTRSERAGAGHESETALSPHLLSDLWSKIRGERSFVSIKLASSFPAALAHALKYPAKFLDKSSPERLAELEATFHHTRRFSTGGAFYNVEVVREPGEDSPIGSCPICGAPLYEIVEPWVPRCALEAEGRGQLEVVRRDVGRAAVFSGPRPP